MSTNSGPATTFNAANAEAYENQMGRWSRRLAPLLIRFGGLADGERVIDVGCGTGSLTFALPEIANVAAVSGIDRAQVYVDFAKARNADHRIEIIQGDARTLPFEKACFDRAFSLLVLQFIPEAERAVAEMRRVVRPGGTISAAVWDGYGGLPHLRMLWDTAAVLDPEASPPRSLFRPLNTPGEMRTLWQRMGLLDVEQTSLLIRMEYANFDDYWQPMVSEGPVKQYTSTLTPSAFETLRDHVKRVFLSNQPDGSRSFACVAWACRGTVPDCAGAIAACWSRTGPFPALAR